MSEDDGVSVGVEMEVGCVDEVDGKEATRGVGWSPRALANCHI